MVLFATTTRDFLNTHFKNWIGHRSLVEWLACSLDLTLCDYTLQEVLKEQVLRLQFHNVVDLKHVIENKREVLQEQPKFFCKSCLTVRNCGKCCIDENGFQFEHKMYLLSICMLFVTIYVYVSIIRDHIVSMELRLYGKNI